MASSPLPVYGLFEGIGRTEVHAEVAAVQLQGCPTLVALYPAVVFAGTTNPSVSPASTPMARRPLYALLATVPFQLIGRTFRRFVCLTPSYPSTPTQASIRSRAT